MVPQEITLEVRLRALSDIHCKTLWGTVNKALPYVVLRVCGRQFKSAVYRYDPKKSTWQLRQHDVMEALGLLTPDSADELRGEPPLSKSSPPAEPVPDQSPPLQPPPSEGGAVAMDDAVVFERMMLFDRVNPLVVEVWDQRLVKDKLIGSGTVILENLCADRREPITLTVPVQSTRYSALVTVELTKRFLPQPAMLANPMPPQPMRILPPLRNDLSRGAPPGLPPPPGWYGTAPAGTQLPVLPPWAMPCAPTQLPDGAPVVYASANYVPRQPLSLPSLTPSPNSSTTEPNGDNRGADATGSLPPVRANGLRQRTSIAVHTPAAQVPLVLAGVGSMENPDESNHANVTTCAHTTPSNSEAILSPTRQQQPTARNVSPRRCECDEGLLVDFQLVDECSGCYPKP